MLPDPEFVANIKGFLDEAEGRRLYELALEASRSGPCLEIGSYCGKSAVYLAAACQVNHSILFSIDHHRGSEEQQPGEAYFDPELFDADNWCPDTFPAFRRSIAQAGLADTIVPIVTRSQVAARCWSTALSLIFIDGGHAHETVEADYRLWAPHLISSGYLVFHDIFTDPREGGQAPHAVYRSAVQSGAYETLPMTKTLGVLKKK